MLNVRQGAIGRGARCAVRGRAVVLAAVLLAGCKLTEEFPAPATDPFLVVHAVLNAQASRQFVIVAKSRRDSVGRSGISGAVVRLTHRTPPPGCASPTVQLAELASPQPGVPGNGVYLTLNLCPLRPGDQVDLRVETPDGDLVTGTTIVPGIDDITIRAGGVTTGPSPATITFDRTRDTLAISTHRSRSPGMQIEAARDDQGGFITYRTTQKDDAIAIAGDLVDPFDEDGRTVFRAGAYYLLSVAAADTNYLDYVISGADPFTGRGFINHLKGAVGIFGSVFTHTYQLKVTAPQADPREGIYRISGTLSGQPVNITWDLYQDDLSDEKNGFSGFVDGTWIDGAIRTSANVVFGLGRLSEEGGFPPPPGFHPDDFYGAIYGAATNPQFPGQVGDEFLITGPRGARGVPFPVIVQYNHQGMDHTDTLTAVQETGP